jgi:hypothetical protein
MHTVQHHREALSTLKNRSPVERLRFMVNHKEWLGAVVPFF